MIGVIPAAGKGSRLGLPFSKELLPLLDKNSFYPIIQSSIEAMKSNGIKKIIIIINHHKSDLIKFLGNGQKFNLVLIYVVQQEPTSLPQALLEAVKISGDEDILFLMPDTLILPNDFLKEFFKKMNHNFPINLGCFITNQPHKFAMISEKNSIVDFIEEKNPNSKLTWMWGFWHWKGSFSEHLKHYNFTFKEDSEITLSHVAEAYIYNKEIYAVLLENHRYRDLGTYDDIREYLKETL